MALTLGVDVGGTFTDVALWDGESVTVAKVLSTVRDQSEGVLAGACAAVPSGAGRRSAPRHDCCHQCLIGTARG